MKGFRSKGSITCKQVALKSLDSDGPLKKMTLLDYYQTVRGTLDYDLHSKILFRRTLKSRALGDVDSKYLEPPVTNPIISDLPVDVSDVSYKTAYVVRPAFDRVEDQREQVHQNCKRAAKSARQWAFSTSGRVRSANEGPRSAASSRPASRPQSGRPEGPSPIRPKSSPIRAPRYGSATSRFVGVEQGGSGRPISGRSVAAVSGRWDLATPTPVKGGTPRSNLKRSRTFFGASSRQDDPVYDEKSKALTDSKARIRAHHSDKHHDLNDGVFARGNKKRENSALSDDSVKQWLSFGGGVKSSAGLVDSFAVMRNPEEYYSIEGQSGLAVAKHLRKMDRVLIGINGQPSIHYGHRSEEKRSSENDWYDKDHIDNLIRQAEELRMTAACNGESIPLSWDDQLSVPDVRTVEAKSNQTLPQTPPKQLSRETTAVVFHKLETEKPHNRHLISPSKHQAAEVGFRVQRRTKTFNRPSTSDAEAIMTIVSIDTEKVDPDSIDYEAFIDERIPTKQFIRRRLTPDSDSVQARSSRQEIRSAHTQASQPYSQPYSQPSTSSDSRIQIRPTSRSIRMEKFEDQDFAIRPLKSAKAPPPPSPTATETPPKSGGSGGRLWRGRSNLGRTAPSITAKYDPTDASYIKFTGGMSSPPSGTLRLEHHPRRPPTTPEYVTPQESAVRGWTVGQPLEPSDTEDETVNLLVPAPSLIDDFEVESVRKGGNMSAIVGRRDLKDGNRRVNDNNSAHKFGKHLADEKTGVYENGGVIEIEEVKAAETAITIPIAQPEENNNDHEPELDLEQEEAEPPQNEENDEVEEDDDETEIEIKQPVVEVRREKRLRFDI